MYIKDSTFYDNVRDTTDASIYFMRPICCDFSVADYSETVHFGDKNTHGAIVQSGLFDRDIPLVTCDGNLKTVQLETTVDLFSMYSSTSEYFINKEALRFVVIYGVDETGKLLAPPGCERVVSYPAYVQHTGVIFEFIDIPPSDNGFLIESIHLCEFIEVRSEDIVKIDRREKNDIILSSIPYDNMEVELYDQDGKYAEFIIRHKERLRALVTFKYNGIHSLMSLYFYGEDPTIDSSSALSKSHIKLVGIMGVLNSITYHNTQTVYSLMNGEFSFDINQYLKTIAGQFNFDRSFVEAFSPEFSLLQIKSFNSHGVRKTHSLTDDILETENYVYRTQSPADGYTYADAIRLLINAQCHGMKVRNSTIIDDSPKNLIVDSGAVLCEREYFSKPVATRYNQVDKITVSTAKWLPGKIVTLPQINFAFFNGGDTFFKDGSTWKRSSFLFEKACVNLAIDWLNGNAFLYLPNTEFVRASSALSMMWNEAEHGKRGYVYISVSANPLEKSNEEVYCKKYGCGKEILEIDNPFLCPRTPGYVEDIPDEYIAYNYMYQSNKIIFSVETRGRFDLHPLDRVSYYDDYGNLRSGIIIEHNLSFDGGMRSSFLIIDDGDVPSQHCNEDRFCSETLICHDLGDISNSSDESGYITNEGYTTTLYDGEPTTHFDFFSSNHKVSIDDFDCFVAVLCDENGENDFTISFSSLSRIETEQIYIDSYTTVDGIDYHLDLEGTWSHIGNSIYGDCSIVEEDPDTVSGVYENPQYITKIYGVRKGNENVV